ncbi:MAG: molecular chaperone TorD family protein [Myxococcales bacterium]|nr:molecular chaperone TorD family protein [Myxococcales bacterium]
MSDERDTLVMRRRAYALLGALLVDGLDEARLEAVRLLPPLAEGLDEPVDLDELAASHYALLGRELPPFAGVFLEGSGLVGVGSAAQVLRSAHSVLGQACPDEPSPDHLGQALRLMAVLADAELDALEQGDVDDAHTLRRWQRTVLDEALLPWMPPLLVALGGQEPSLWTRVLELAVGVLARHRADDSTLPRATGPARDEALSAEGLLDDPRTGLRTVAELLGLPARSGLFLGRRDIEAVARRCELPRGFGSRRDMLERLLRAAAEYQLLPRVLDELQRLLAARDDAYAGLANEPGLAAVVPAWRRRVEATQGLLQRLSEAAARVGQGGDALETG